MKKARTPPPTVFDRVQVILDSAQSHAARSVNTTQVVANWLIGREIVEEQQQGARRAGYGEKILPELARRLKESGKRGYSEQTLRYCRQFYLSYPDLPGAQICHALRGKLGEPQICHAGRGELAAPKNAAPICYALRNQPAALIFVDLKVRKLTHQDIGQMQLYTNYYDQERCTEGDNLTLGLILCTDQNETAVRYTLGPGQQKIFASRYQFHLPSEADLAAEIRRELAELATAGKPKPTARAKR